jgi:hypothetical protein
MSDYDRGVPRRWLAWVVATALAVAGSQAAHALAYHFVVTDSGERSQVLAGTGHGYLTLAPFGLALVTAILMLALVSEVRLSASGAASRTPAFWSFAALAPLTFVCQEHFERLLHDGTFPWGAATQPTFAVGLALQLPFALIAYLVARVFLRAARLLGRLLTGPRRDVERDHGRSWPALAASPVRLPALSLGYGTRGPPGSRAF